MVSATYDLSPSFTTGTLVGLPVEILLLIVSALEPGDVISVRQVRTFEHTQRFASDLSMHLPLFFSETIPELCFTC